MAPDEQFESAIQSLLDGRPLSLDTDGASDTARANPLRVVEAIARAHRTAIFGSDIPLEPTVATRWGHMEIRGELGRGASGVVFRAWDPNLAREVALKLLTADSGAADALEEGRLLARLNHPHIVRVYGADMHDGAAGIWMELLEGETLDQILARDGVFSEEAALLVGLDLAGALEAVHAAGLLHRDIKVRNVLRERGGRVVLMDSGAGRLASHGADGRDEAGTPMYMAPEVLAGDAATVRSDIYSLGVLLFRLLTRTYPVVAADVSALRSAHAAGARTSPAALRADLTSATVTSVDRASHPDPAARFGSAAELEAALGDALERFLVSGTRVISPFARRWARWRKTTFVTAAAIAVTLLTAATAWETTRGRAVRRALGLTVPPRGALYVTMGGGLVLVRGQSLTVMPYNPGNATRITVSSDLGVRTMSGGPPWKSGGAFRLNGTPVAAPAVMNSLCCFSDGATDGEFSYAARQDSILFDPPGSRPLAPPAVYRFKRDWSNPEMLFPLEPDGTYSGIAYSGATRTFWLTNNVRDGARIEQWSRDGKHLSTVTVPANVLTGIAVDPIDGTLWALRQQLAAVALHLENFDLSGRHLASVQLPLPMTIPWGPYGAEFEWVSPQ